MASIIDIPPFLRRGYPECPVSAERPRRYRSGGRITRHGYYGDLLEKCRKARTRAAKKKKRERERRDRGRQ